MGDVYSAIDQLANEGSLVTVALLFIAVQALGSGIAMAAYGAWNERRYYALRTALEVASRNDIAAVRKEAQAQIADAKTAAKEAEERSRIRVDLMLELVTGHGRIPGGGNEHTLLEFLMSKFNMNELKLLANEAGIDWDSFGGDTVPSKALEMVKFAKRTGKLLQLEASAKRARSE